MKGAEVAYRTLQGEDAGEPCILGDWMFNPAFFPAVTGRRINEDPTAKSASPDHLRKVATIA